MNIHTIFVMDLYVATNMDLSSYVVDWVCDLDIVVDLVFMYEDDVMDVMMISCRWSIMIFS